MNKTALKNFATWARRQLIAQVETKALLYGVNKTTNLQMEEQFGQLLINGQNYPLSMKSAFIALQQQLQQKGYEQLLEEAAYTWFNRIIAIRYMEVHGYLPERVNVLSSTEGRVDPDILFEYDSMDLAIQPDQVREYVNRGNTEAAYRLLFVAQCNALNRILPFMFEEIQDFTELLLPDFLLDAESVIKKLVQSEDLTESFGEIEVIGWLYQYYIHEKKIEVGGQTNKAVGKENIAIVTQIFTPKWIVKYMLENSLGELYLQKNRESLLKGKWGYLTSGDVDLFDNQGLKNSNIEDLKFLDPACGSGHILVQAFEMFFEMYLEKGYPERRIPELILTKNLFGLDIDKRAVQIANFSLVMKVMSKNKRLLKNLFITPQIFEFIDSKKELNHDGINLFFEENEKVLIELINTKFYDAKQTGSLIRIGYEKEINELIRKIENLDVDTLDLIQQAYLINIKEIILPKLKISRVLSSKYDVVVTNPPYLNKFNSNLKKYLTKNYNDYKSDLYSAFVVRSIELTKAGGKTALMTPFTWMFIKTHEKLREYILSNVELSSLVQLEQAAFKDAAVSICTFILTKTNIKNAGKYIRLTDLKGEQGEFVQKIIENKIENKMFTFNQKKLEVIPGKPISYWISEEAITNFEVAPNIGNSNSAKKGMLTGDNEKYLRFWYEVELDNIGFLCGSCEDTLNSNFTWVPYNKGGQYRKWYGNNLYVVKWKNNGEEIKKFVTKKHGHYSKWLFNLEFMFKESITWSNINSSAFGARYQPEGYMFDQKGPSLFGENPLYMLGLLNSKVAEYFIDIINPTVSINPGDIEKIPYILKENDKKKIELLVQENINLMKKDWDFKELSIDFKGTALIQYGEEKINNSYRKYKEEFNEFRLNLVNNEKLLNEYFINLYGLNTELNKEIKENEISLEVKSSNVLAKELCSYFIGTKFARFPKKASSTSESAILNFTEYGDDIITQLREFLSITFSSETVEENLQWIAEALEMKNGEDAETRIRRYFMDEFFTDHCKMYQKRPIYWLVDSGKQKGLRTLVYMHRYQPDTMATIRFEHLQEIQAKYQQEIADIESRLVNPNLSATNKKKLNSEKVSFEKKIDELREFDKRLAVIAAEEIEIDLDDGVKVNYEKFYRDGKGVLAKIK